MPTTLTVTQLNTYIKSMFDGDSHLRSVFVVGEISNFINHYKSGHFYLSLKDSKSVIKAVMFASQARRLRFMPQDGMKVLVRGRVSVYEANGQYQLYIDDLQPDGLGALNLAFEQCKEKLAAEGLFDQSRKKPIPAYPERVGVITSPTGAAVHDIQHILGRRYPLAEIVFAPVLVQGDGAVAQIVEALHTFNRLHSADVILLGRGGGSLEDLWAFNTEEVARAVAASEIPVISAVGHETDVTICDFAADLRAPTPSAAAELAVPDWKEVAGLLNGYQYTLRQSMERKYQRCSEAFQQAMQCRFLSHPEEWISLRKMEVDQQAQRLTEGIRRQLTDTQTAFAALNGKLDALSPLKVLSRGYATVSNQKGKTVCDPAKVKPGEQLQLRFSQGTIDCTVDTVSMTGGNQDE